MTKDLARSGEVGSGSGRSSGTLLKLPTVSDFMSRDIITVTPSTGILDAVDRLIKHRISGMPVVDDNGALVGIISEKDCLKIVATGVGHERPHGQVADFMTTDVQTIKPSMDIYFVAGLLLKTIFRRFPVVDKDGHLVGVISRVDVLRAIRSILAVETVPISIDEEE